MSCTGPDLLPRRFLCPISLTPQVIGGSETSAAAAGACPTAPSAATTHPHAPWRDTPPEVWSPHPEELAAGPGHPLRTRCVSQLVASSSADTGTDIDLSVPWYAGALRLTIGDHGSALPGQQPAASTCRGKDSPSS
jgi:hypothetical protein